jgi:hypothetical protein
MLGLKVLKKIKDKGRLITEKELSKSQYINIQLKYQMINNDIKLTVGGVIEVTHAPTGCMLIKRSVI